MEEEDGSQGEGTRTPWILDFFSQSSFFVEREREIEIWAIEARREREREIY